MRHGFPRKILVASCLVGLSASAAVAAAGGSGGSTDDAAALVRDLTSRISITRGVCCLVGCDDESLPMELARQTDLLIHVWEPRAAIVDRVRPVLVREGLYGHRVVIEAGDLRQLPYADSMIDVVLSTTVTAAQLEDLKAAEVLRVLRPLGKAIVGRAGKVGADRPTRDSLTMWSKSAPSGSAKIQDDEHGLWLEMTKPALSGVDDWSHWEHAPDNNPVSTDQVIKAPYMSQWLGLPYYIAMPAITTASGGRVFTAMGHIAHHEREEGWLNILVARNGYNGTILWTRKFPDGYLAHRSAFIATPSTFLMIDDDGTGVLRLDPETGEQKGRIAVPGLHGDWKWIAMKDGILFALVGKEKDPAETTIVRSSNPHWSWGELSNGYYTPRVPWGFGQTIVAIEAATGKLIWRRNESKPVDSRAMVIGGDRLYFYGPDSHLGCLEARTGKEVWINADPAIREMIEQPGRGLTSTPGWRTSCFAVYSPEALFYEAQTNMNIVAVSLDDGHVLWHRPKTTSNPNVLYLDGRVLVGIGPGGNTLALDPKTGNTLENLGFRKRSCARLTATPDSLFCRGQPEGMTRYDRATQKILFNAAFRPSCNDGMIAANGLLYTGPWACDCNLSLMGQLAFCSAGSFDFKPAVGNTERLQITAGDLSQVAPFDISDKDWTSYRGNADRSAASGATVPRKAVRVWEFNPGEPIQPTSATAAGGFIFIGGDDGLVRAIETATGTQKWSFATAGPIIQPPTLWQGRAYVGSGDGYIYCLEAASGRLLWRFRAAPTERRIMVYGALSSTWPVNTGVLVKDGVACAAAGIIDYDGTYLYALDAVTGKVIWENTTSGHLDENLRKGVSAQGTLTVAADRVWMPGGNVISPASFDLKSGKYRGPGPGNGSPQADRGEEIGVMRKSLLVRGGRSLFSARQVVVDSGRFVVTPVSADGNTGRDLVLGSSRVPPAWDDNRMVLLPARGSPPVCALADKIETQATSGQQAAKLDPSWRAQWLEGTDAVSLAMASNAILAVTRKRTPGRLAPDWRLHCINPEDGSQVWEQQLPGSALPGGLVVDRDGRVIVVLEDGRVACFGHLQALRDAVSFVAKGPAGNRAERQRTIGFLRGALARDDDPEFRRTVRQMLAELGPRTNSEEAKQGWVVDWRLIGPVPWDPKNNPTDKVFIGEPDVNIDKGYRVQGKRLNWREYNNDEPGPSVDLYKLYGPLTDCAVYAYAEIPLDSDVEIKLKLGSDDGYKCWFNGQVAGTMEAKRGFQPEQDVLKVQGRKGVNKLLLKVTQYDMGWAFGVRVTDANDKPIDVNVK